MAAPRPWHILLELVNGALSSAPRDGIAL